MGFVAVSDTISNQPPLKISALQNNPHKISKRGIYSQLLIPTPFPQKKKKKKKKKKLRFAIYSQLYIAKKRLKGCFQSNLHLDYVYKCYLFIVFYVKPFIFLFDLFTTVEKSNTYDCR